MTPNPARPAGTGRRGAAARAKDYSVEREPIGMMLMETAHAVARRLQPAFDAGTLKPRHVRLLRVFAEQQQPTTQQKLGEALRIDPSMVVGLLNDLERDGLVERIRDPEDRRRHLVHLTPHGDSVLQEVLARVMAAEAAAFAGLTPAQQRTLRNLLLIVRQSGQE